MTRILVCCAFGIAVLAAGLGLCLAATDDDNLPNDVPSLIKLLHDKDPQVRGRAASHLVTLQEKAAPAIPDLISLLSDDETAERMAVANNCVWNAAQWTLSGMGKQAIQPLIEALENSNPKIRERACIALRYMRQPPKEAVPALMRRFTESDHNIRRNAVHALACIGKDAEQAVPSILALATDDSDKYVRQAAVGAAAMLDGNGKLAMPACIRALRDEASDVRGQAARSLGEYGTKAEAAVPALAAQLDDQAMRVESYAPDFSGLLAVRYDVAEALGKIGRSAAPALPKLHKMLRSDEDDVVRAIVAKAILQIDPSNKDAMPELIALVEHDKDGTAGVEAALAVLKDFGPSAVAAVPAIQGALRCKWYETRGQAAETLVAVAGKKAVHTLIEQMKWEQRIGEEQRDHEKNLPENERNGYDEDITVCVQIAAALGQLGPDAAPAVPLLSALLDNPLVYSKEEVIEALGRIGPAAKPAVPRLRQLADGDFYESERVAAETALKRIGESESKTGLKP